MFDHNEIPSYSLPLFAFLFGLLISTLFFLWIKKRRWDRFYVSRAVVSQQLAAYEDQINQINPIKKSATGSSATHAEKERFAAENPIEERAEYMKSLPSQIDSLKMEPDMPPETMPPPPFLSLSTLSISPELSPLNGDNLTLIRGITPEMALQLNRIGITSFRQIAEWTSLDVRRVAAVLNLDNRIFQENWIVQAQSLYFERVHNRFRFGK
ncbi:MAG TPA: hypothetical protein PLO56_04125 [Rhodothermales bacterium]|nr:hypothetical protein [Rhodothermales bacterium]